MLVFIPGFRVQGLGALVFRISTFRVSARHVLVGRLSETSLEARDPWIYVGFRISRAFRA